MALGFHCSAVLMLASFPLFQDISQLANGLRSTHTGLPGLVVKHNFWLRCGLCLLPPSPQGIGFQPLVPLPRNAALIVMVPAACRKAEFNAMLAQAEEWSRLFSLRLRARSVLESDEFKKADVKPVV